jgi:ferredoxin
MANSVHQILHEVPSSLMPPAGKYAPVGGITWCRPVSVGSDQSMTDSQAVCRCATRGCHEGAGPDGIEPPPDHPGAAPAARLGTHGPPHQRVASNADGDFCVDASCIDCETCRATAPGVLGRDARLGQSVVRAQPDSPDKQRRALMALVACPTASIGTIRKHNA